MAMAMPVTASMSGAMTVAAGTGQPFCILITSVSEIMVSHGDRDPKARWRSTADRGAICEVDRRTDGNHSTLGSENSTRARFHYRTRNLKMHHQDTKVTKGSRRTSFLLIPTAPHRFVEEVQENRERIASVIPKTNFFFGVLGVLVVKLAGGRNSPNE